MWGNRQIALILLAIFYNYGKIPKKSIRLRADRKSGFMQNVKLLWMWFFSIVPSRGTLAAI